MPQDQKIFFHIGPPKTGSTAIQSHMTEGRQEHQELGVYYPTDFRNKHQGVASALFLDFEHHKNIRWPQRFYANKEIALNQAQYDTQRAAYHKEITDAVARGCNIVISSEGLFRDGLSDHEPPVSRIAAENACKYAKSLSLTPKVVLYLRNPIAWWLSHIHQSSLRFNPADDGYLISCSFQPLALVKQKIELMTEVFGSENLICRCLDHNLVGGSLVHDFRHIVGLPETDDLSAGVANKKDYGKSIVLRQKLNSFLHSRPGNTLSYGDEVSLNVRNYANIFPTDRSEYLPSGRIFRAGMEAIEPYRQYFLELTQNETLFGADYAQPYLERLTEEEQPQIGEKEFLSAIHSIQKHADHKLVRTLATKVNISETEQWFAHHIRLVHSLKLLKFVRNKAAKDGAYRIAALYGQALIDRQPETNPVDVKVLAEIQAKL